MIFSSAYEVVQAALVVLQHPTETLPPLPHFHSILPSHHLQGLTGAKALQCHLQRPQAQPLAEWGIHR